MPSWLLLAIGLLTGAPSPPKLTAKLTPKGVLILQADKPHKVDVSAYLKDLRPTSIRVELVQRDPTALYIILTGSQLSSTNPNGYCGAGEEDLLLWLQLSPTFALQKASGLLYASCIFSIEPITERCIDGLLQGTTCTINNFHDKTTLLVAFDPAHPDQGLDVRTMPLAQK